MVQLGCETDFVAKTDRFQDGLRAILQTFNAQDDLIIAGEAAADQDYLGKLCA